MSKFDKRNSTTILELLKRKTHLSSELYDVEEDLRLAVIASYPQCVTINWRKLNHLMNAKPAVKKNDAFPPFADEEV